MFTMDKNKEISPLFLNRLRFVVTSRYKISTNNVKDVFFEEALYAHIINEFATIPFTVPADSIFSIFSLLSAEPNKEEQQLKDSFRYIHEATHSQINDIRITDYESFLTQNLFNMIQFINLSLYLYKRYLHEERSKKEITMLKKMLIISASAQYGEMYSSRGKNEFAYYFKRLLDNHCDSTLAILPYNKKTWRSVYARYTKIAKDEIDTILEKSHQQEEIRKVSNICISYGKKRDTRLPHLGERYVIEAGISNHNKEYNRIFIATF
jgi:hypothetical protein